MRYPKLLFAVLGAVLVVAALSAGVAAAQGSSEPNPGGTALQPTTSSDLSSTWAAGFDLDLFTRLRIGVLSQYSWGRGATVRPGVLRSSFAVLRERRGLTR